MAHLPLFKNTVSNISEGLIYSLAVSSSRTRTLEGRGCDGLIVPAPHYLKIPHVNCAPRRRFTTDRGVAKLLLQDQRG